MDDVEANLITRMDLLKLGVVGILRSYLGLIEVSAAHLSILTWTQLLLLC